MKAFTFLLFSTFFAAFLVRIVGIYPGYPNIHPDESSSYGTAVYMFYNFLHPGRFDYPAGVPFLNLILYASFLIPTSLIEIFFRDPFALLGDAELFTTYRTAIFGHWDLNAMYWTRAITALFGTGSVIFLYFAARNLFNKYVGFFSAFFLAFNYLHVVRSHFGLPDAYSSFFLAVMLYLCAKLLKKDSLGNYLLAGLVGGIAFSLKYQVFAFLPFFMTHFFIVLRKRKPFLFFRKEFFLSLLISALTFLLVNPYYLLNIAEAIRQNTNDVRRYQMGSLFFRPYSYFYLFNFGIGQSASIAFVLGMILMFFRSMRNWFILMSFVFPFFFFMTYYSQGGIFTRNFANVMPFLMVFAGFFVWVVYVLFRRLGTSISIFLMSAILIYLNFQSMTNSLILDISYIKPWNVNRLSEWLQSSLPENVTIRYYQLFLPQKGMDALVDKKIIQKDWDYVEGPNSLAEFQEEKTDFAILNTNPLQSITYWWRGYPELYLPTNSMPYDFIENGFHGLSIKELSRYTVFEAYKPWQSHYENNYIVYKIPKQPKELGEKIANFSFDGKENLWQLRGDLGFEPMKVSWAEGAVVATSSGSTSRLASSAIHVNEELLYTVKGNIKTSNITDGERDGFLRIDFYKEDTKETLEKIGNSVAISGRAPATGEWSKIQTSAVAPRGAKFMTVSFQFKNAYFSSVFDDIEVFESKIVPEEQFKEVPYIKSTIPVESLYYNTFI